MLILQYKSQQFLSPSTVQFTQPASSKMNAKILIVALCAFQVRKLIAATDVAWRLLQLQTLTGSAVLSDIRQHLALINGLLHKLKLSLYRHTYALRAHKIFKSKLINVAPAALTPKEFSGTHFYQRMSQTQGHGAAGMIRSMKNLKDPIGNGTRHLRACSSSASTNRVTVYLCLNK